jgi:hypothetical protein|tara:strand:+ start:123 stop:530 length:408 start_codon:yes stop_codon:yes gene_type:complete
MQLRNQYLEALGIPDFLYSKIESKNSSETLLKLLIVEVGAQNSFCSKGDSQDLLLKMLASIDLSIRSAQLVSLEKNLIDEYIKNNPSEAVMIMDPSYKSIKSDIFLMHHPRDILKNSSLKRESWEILKKVKKCLK